MRSKPEYKMRPNRRVVKFPVQVVRERDFRLLADRIEDLSPYGMLVGPADAAVTGERVFVSFRLGDTSDWIDVEAQVVRVEHGRRPSETARRLGLEFIGLSPYDRYRIQRSIAHRPVPPPRYRPGRRGSSFLLSDWVGKTAASWVLA